MIVLPRRGSGCVRAGGCSKHVVASERGRLAAGLAAHLSGTRERVVLPSAKAQSIALTKRRAVKDRARAGELLNKLGSLDVTSRDMKLRLQLLAPLPDRSHAVLLEW